MKNMLLAVAAILVALTLPSAASAQCVIFEDPAEAFKIADMVFVGRVVSNEPTGNSGSHVTTHIATFRLERSWKGPPDRQIRVGSDAPLEVGKRYVVFAAGKPLFSSIQCDWAIAVERAKRKLDWLSTKRSRPG